MFNLHPLLDYRIVEKAARIPPELKFSGMSGKEILKRGFSDLLSPEILAAGKRGFNVPLADWFKDDSKREYLSTFLQPDSFINPVGTAWICHTLGRSRDRARLDVF